MKKIDYDLLNYINSVPLPCPADCQLILLNLKTNENRTNRKHYRQ